MDEKYRPTLEFATLSLNMAATKFSDLGYDLIASLKPRKDCKFVGKLIPIEINERLKDIKDNKND
jgi:hypothetical protein